MFTEKRLGGKFSAEEVSSKVKKKREGMTFSDLQNVGYKFTRINLCMLRRSRVMHFSEIYLN